MDFLDIPSYIQQKVQASLEEQGKDDSENLNAYNLLLEKGEMGQESCDDYIGTLQDLTEIELCNKFGVDIQKLEMHFQNLVPKILYILNFFQTGQSDVLPENLNPATILNNSGLEGNLKHPNNLDIATILRILVMLHEKFSSSLLFSSSYKLEKFQYYFDGLGLLKINFDSNDLQILITDQIKIEAFTTIRIKFNLKCFVKQMIIFENSENLEGVTSDISTQLGPYYSYSEVLVHNFRNVPVILEQDTHLGNLSIKTLSNDVTFWPQLVKEEIFDKLGGHYENSKNFEMRNKLSESIYQMLKCTNPLLNNFKINDLNSHESLQQKQIFLTELILKAKVDINTLELNKRGAVKLKFHRMLENLNSLLLGQFLIKTGLQISTKDLEQIQTSDTRLYSIKTQLDQFTDFEIHKKILYKVSEIYGQTLYRLCLPAYLGRDIMGKLHYKSEAHLSLGNLIGIFNQNFYTPNIEKLGKQIIQSCVICKLNRNMYKKQTLGENRQERNNLQVGKVWTCDIAYLPKSATGYKYLLVFAENLTSYLACISLKNITCQTVSQALKVFLGIIPAPAKLKSDFGKEFSNFFTLTCNKFGIEHSNEIPRRSQSSGACELGIKLIKQGLSRICSANMKGRGIWPDLVPKLVQSINSFFPYRSCLSRTQLFFSPYFNTATQLQVQNPVKLQRDQYLELNRRRILNLAKKGRGLLPRDFRVGEYVLLHDLPTKTVEGSRQLNLPLSKDLYKIIQVHKEGFSFTLLNVRSLDKITVLHSRISHVDLDTLLGYDIGQPNLWDKLSQLNVKNRNTYQMGPTKRKLALVNQEDYMTNEIEGGDIFDNPGEDTRGDEENEKEMLEDELLDVDEVLPKKDDILNMEHHSGYNLRSRNINQLETETFKDDELRQLNKNSLLKSFRGYRGENNFDINKFRLTDQSEFKAIKKALSLHVRVCFQIGCETCVFYNAIKNMVYTANDLPKYNFGHHDISDIKINKEKCKVQFNQTLDFSNGDEKQLIEINWTKIQLSTYFCCSLREMKNMKI